MEENQVDDANLNDILNDMSYHNANIQEPESDWMLRYLVNLANQQGLQMGITLQVDGMLVSGILVGGQTYFEGITQNISEAMGASEETKSIPELFQRINKAVQTEAGADKPMPPPAYIHLKNTYFFNTANDTPIPNGEGVWWRGKLAQVSGFFFGNLSA